MSRRILVVDDHETVVRTLKRALEDEGYEVFAAFDGRTAIDIIREHDLDVVLADLLMPDVDGIEVLQKTMELSPQTFVIIMTAYATVKSAVQAMQRGAYDYIIKPFAFDDIILKIEHLSKYRDLALENQALRQELRERYDFHNIIGESKAMQKVFDLIKGVAPTASNVLILGESGAGKELVARAVHFNSHRRNKRFVPVNCAAIPSDLLESELFGHLKGAFTGADRDRTGLFAEADGGSIFLDEIGELPLPLQAKLLRVIEDKEVRPVGSSKPSKVDARLICATNKDLAKEVEAHTFREDLYYRLNVVEILIPPLRERKEDIPPLVRHFIRKYNIELKKNFKGVDNATMKALLDHPWRGNVRELENVIERAMIVAKGVFITRSDLPVNLTRSSQVDVPNSLHEAMRLYETQHIRCVLERVSYNHRKAIQELAIGRTSFYRKLAELGIPSKPEPQ